MAVDSRDKRFSMMGLLQPVPSVLPNPDGTIGLPDQNQYAFMYHGIDLDPLAPILVSRWFKRHQGIILGTMNPGRMLYHKRNY